MFIKLLRAVEQHPQLTQAEQLTQPQLIPEQLTLPRHTLAELIQQQLTQVAEQKAMARHVPLTMNAAQTFVLEEFALQQLRDILVQHILAELIRLTHQQVIKHLNAVQELHGIATLLMPAKILGQTGALKAELQDTAQQQLAQPMPDQHMLRNQHIKPANRNLQQQ